MGHALYACFKKCWLRIVSGRILALTSSEFAPMRPCTVRPFTRIAWPWCRPFQHFTWLAEYIRDKFRGVLLLLDQDKKVLSCRRHSKVWFLTMYYTLCIKSFIERESDQEEGGDDLSSGNHAFKTRLTLTALRNRTRMARKVPLLHEPRSIKHQSWPELRVPNFSILEICCAQNSSTSRM